MVISPMLKFPYKSTNRRTGFPSQMCRYSDRLGKLSLQDNYLQWRFSARSFPPAGGDEDSDSDLEDELYEDDEDEDIAEGTQGPRRRLLRSCRVKHLLAMNMPTPILDGVALSEQTETDLITANETTVFKLTSRLAHLNSILGDISTLYNLPDLRGAIGDYLKDTARGDFTGRRSRRVSLADCPLPFSNIDVWDHVRMQLKGTQDDSTLLPFQTVQVLQPDDSAGMPFGRCNFVLVKDPQDQDYIGLAEGLCHCVYCYPSYISTDKELQTLNFYFKCMQDILLHNYG